MYDKSRKVLKYVRDSHDLTQESLSDITGYCVDSIRKWENGSTPVNIPALIELADKLDAPGLELIYLREQYGDKLLRTIIPDFSIGRPVAEAYAGVISTAMELIDEKFDRKMLRMMADGRIDELEKQDSAIIDAWTLRMIAAGIESLCSDRRGGNRE